MEHYFSHFNEVFHSQWDKPAISDFDGDVSYTYGELAERVAKLGVLYELLGLHAGDKIAICGRNSSHWALGYISIAAFKGVVVSILQDFNGEDIQGLINHSDAQVLLVCPFVWKTIQPDKMPNLRVIISLTDFSILYSKDGSYSDVVERAEVAFAERYPTGFHREDLSFPTDNIDDLALINYTSGSTGTPKGVMLTYRSLSNNVEQGKYVLPSKYGEEVVSMLPLAHAYGQLSDFLLQLASGCHIYYLRKSPTPTTLMKAFQAVHPYMIVTVPLVIEKLYKKNIQPIIQRPLMRKLWNMPLTAPFIRRTVYKKLMKAFGGNVRYFLCGGAAINPEVERCLMDIHFPLTIGYGMTECGPLVSGTPPKKFVARSSGQILPNMEAKVIPLEEGNPCGEIYVRGANVMLGYYKNDAATREVMMDDGWMKTGDVGIIDDKNYIFLKGRNKNMILGASGQNIYPEEIEDKLNNLEGVVESIVVERDGRLYGLVFPDYSKDGNPDKGEKSILEMMKDNLKKLNEMLPSYSKVSNIEIMDKEFEKTPKKSIKRFLYK